MIITLPLPEHDPALEISLRNTSLEVEPSGDGGATARFIPAGEDAPRDTGERFVVHTREPDDGGAPIVCVEEQRLEDPDAAGKGRLLVQVAEPTRLRLRSRNGGIEARDLAGQLHLRTRNGAINVRNNRGPVSAGAANGRVHLCAVHGPSVDVSAANGSVSLSDIETPRLRISTSNGRVRVADARIGGGTVRSANGRIALQISPLAAASDPASESAAADAADGGDGRLSVYSANGPVTVALPERINATVKAHTGGVLRNHLGSARSRTDHSVTTLQFGDGEPQLLILIKNLRGGIEVTKHADFESRRTADEGFSDDDARNYGVWFDVDFSEEFPRFMRDMKEFGTKFGRLGEEVSREMRRAFRFGGGGRRGPRPWHEEGREASAGAAPDGGDGAERGDAGAEVKTVLDLLKEGKISVEEAERLIAALRQ
ncbi:MAG: DUF4097 family beta strand repeat-containing protein [Spirochaetaceae bacterium]|nr:DUF4097 family beta strand repeat-containing protein [Spirochaetaceae bacterium]